MKMECDACDNINDCCAHKLILRSMHVATFFGRKKVLLIWFIQKHQWDFLHRYSYLLEATILGIIDRWRFTFYCLFTSDLNFRTRLEWVELTQLFKLLLLLLLQKTKISVEILFLALLAQNTRSQSSEQSF